ncbi:MAG: hypothetical protein ACYDBY_06515 [Thermoanaerobaculia bacterium]
MNAPPDVSVVGAVSLSEATLEGFLDALARQTFRSFETKLVDSGPTEACARLVAAHGETGEVRNHHGKLSLSIAAPPAQTRRTASVAK